MNRVVADSNVYVSAIVFGGKPMLLLEMAEEGELELFISEPILSETFRILRNKFQRTTEQLEADRVHLGTITRSVTPTETLNVVPLDPDEPEGRMFESCRAQQLPSENQSRCCAVAVVRNNWIRTVWA